MDYPDRAPLELSLVDELEQHARARLDEDPESEMLKSLVCVIEDYKSLRELLMRDAQGELAVVARQHRIINDLEITAERRRLEIERLQRDNEVLRGRFVVLKKNLQSMGDVVKTLSAASDNDGAGLDALKKG
jgi:hypothetical protein